MKESTPVAYQFARTLEAAAELFVEVITGAAEISEVRIVEEACASVDSEASGNGVPDVSIRDFS